MKRAKKFLKKLKKVLTFVVNNDNIKLQQGKRHKTIEKVRSVKIMVMFIVKYKQEDKEECYLYYDRQEYIKDTFLPMLTVIDILDFKIKGKTYQERKVYLEELAKEWQLHFSDYSWSMGELADIQWYFYENAKRYGLVKEFKENCIC